MICLKANSVTEMVSSTWFKKAESAPFWRGNESPSHRFRSGSHRPRPKGTGARGGEVSDAAGVPVADGPRSFRGDGLRPVDLSRGTARHRGLSGMSFATHLPHGHPGPGDAHEPGLRQRQSRLAGVRRGRLRAHASSSAVVRGLSVRTGLGSGPVRLGRDPDRVERGAVSLGPLAEGSGIGEAQRAAGSAGRHPGFCQSPRGESARGGLSRRDPCVSGIVLRHRSGLSWTSFGCMRCTWPERSSSRD